MVNPPPRLRTAVPQELEWLRVYAPIHLATVSPRFVIEHRKDRCLPLKSRSHKKRRKKNKKISDPEAYIEIKSHGVAKLQIHIYYTQETSRKADAERKIYSQVFRVIMLRERYGKEKS